MKNGNQNTGSIRVLPDHVARKIAAGEVIDRPFSVIRELLDNSIDAGSDSISVSIGDGGIADIRVVDNGRGMNRDDMQLCFLPHATSKIKDVEDIYHIRTLGFRGEALSSIAACSHLEIISAEKKAAFGHRLLVSGGKFISLDEYKSNSGTIVHISSLFYNLPGRKKFLKSPSAESMMCRTAFIEKCLPFPGIAFKFSVNNTIKLTLPAAELHERVAAVLGEISLQTAVPSAAFIFAEDIRENFSIQCVLARPEIKRNDRKHIHIFINKRKVNEYAFLQAVEYAYSDYMPGKDHPVAAVFIDIEPELVDFNIHPAKRECKMLIQPQIHQCLVSVIKSALGGFSISVNKPVTPIHEQPYQTGFSEFSRKEREVKETPPLYTAIRQERTEKTEVPEKKRVPIDNTEDEQPVYLGQAFGLFIIASYRDNLYIVDQHAAHERLLYEEFSTRQPVAQELLFPVSFDVTSDEEKHLQKQKEFLDRQGIRIEKTGKGTWEITALPSHFHDTDTQQIVLFLKELGGSITEPEKRLNAIAACRNALKDGDPVDPVTAQNLLQRVFALGNARCPHGRPVWYVISKEELFRLLGRK